jgi:hypothetical protein
MSPLPSRRQKRWSGRLRTAGALLLLGGVVALIDGLLPQANDPVLGGLPHRWAIAALFLGVGAVAFWLGRRWR